MPVYLVVQLIDTARVCDVLKIRPTEE